MKTEINISNRSIITRETQVTKGPEIGGFQMGLGADIRFSIWGEIWLGQIQWSGDMGFRVEDLVWHMTAIYDVIFNYKQ